MDWLLLSLIILLPPMATTTSSFMIKDPDTEYLADSGCTAHTHYKDWRITLIYSVFQLFQLVAAPLIGDHLKSV